MKDVFVLPKGYAARKLLGEVLGLGSLALISLILRHFGWNTASSLSVVLLCVAGVLTIFFATILWPSRVRTYRLSISSGVVCIEVGKLFYKRTMLPCARINSVKYSENAADRLFGHARLTIVSTTLTTELEPLDKFDAQYIEEQLTRR
ncbi:PH domain-containing protein [Arcanobacterium phocae]|uniref:PH domain-containing protein n=1 Tax=Arcanobacterium phocae TaxID=131112 RepID=UPI001C0E9166|nr:PH domain-containing protein [Arcanobacterium phocae]